VLAPSELCELVLFDSSLTSLADFWPILLVRNPVEIHWLLFTDRLKTQMATEVSGFAAEREQWRSPNRAKQFRRSTSRENCRYSGRSSALMNGVIWRQALVAFTAVRFQV
jgi:hypothetical protein